MPSPVCYKCSGPVTDYDAICDAVRAKGWSLVIETADPDGDWVTIHDEYGDEIGRCSPLLGLRNAEALLTALSRCPLEGE